MWMAFANSFCHCLLSRPAWGEWIEIFHAYASAAMHARSRPAWGEWIEICVSIRSSSSTLVPAPIVQVDLANSKHN